MKIAVASSDFQSVSGHAGRAKKWLIYSVDENAQISAAQRIELPSDQVIHYVEESGGPHPLDGIDVVITLSAGDGFVKHMEKRGAQVAMTAEKDAAKAVHDFLTQTLSDPKPRPIGSLICKTIDLFSKHK
ncbi:MAG: NifB/NifX family molybdenum-iron cluster-binding protein [Magnetospirillum sp.]